MNGSVSVMQCDSSGRVGRDRVLDVRRGSGGSPSSSDTVVRSPTSSHPMCSKNRRAIATHPLAVKSWACGRTKMSCRCVGGYGFAAGRACEI